MRPCNEQGVGGLVADMGDDMRPEGRVQSGSDTVQFKLYGKE